MTAAQQRHPDEPWSPELARRYGPDILRRLNQQPDRPQRFARGGLIRPDHTLTEFLIALAYGHDEGTPMTNPRTPGDPQ